MRSIFNFSDDEIAPFREWLRNAPPPPPISATSSVIQTAASGGMAVDSEGNDAVSSAEGQPSAVATTPSTPAWIKPGYTVASSVAGGQPLATNIAK